MKRWDHPEAGEWVSPVLRGYRFRCCDCNLTHILDFRVVKGRVQFRVFRDNRTTAAFRRKKRRAQ